MITPRSVLATVIVALAAVFARALFHFEEEEGVDEWWTLKEDLAERGTEHGVREEPQQE